ncbi:MAG: winged helix-turn-helix domain-containing protein [Thermoplasmata archaeon]
MPSDLHPALRRLLGGETRAKVLGLLADATVPKTGYELAKAARVSPSKVYAILRDLAEAGLVQTVSNRPGVRRYSLADPDLRRFLLRHVRITTIEEWFSPARVQAREATLGRLKPMRFEIRSSRTRRERLPNYREFERPPEKDRALRRVARRHASRG